jgi:hypothetical protein
MMGKRKKIEETWECGDCNAELPVSTKWCDAPQHYLAEKVARLQALLRIAAEARNEEDVDKYYLTAEEFVENLMPPMKEYMIKMYGKEKCHPHDLATAAASFMDAYWIISEHRAL